MGLRVGENKARLNPRARAWEKQTLALQLWDDLRPVPARADCQVRLLTQRAGARMAYHTVEADRDRWKERARVPPPLSPRLHLVLMQHIPPAVTLTSMYFQVSGATKPPSAGYRPNHTVMRKDKHISEAVY